MTNLGEMLKSEILRLARKSVRMSFPSLKKDIKDFRRSLRLMTVKVQRLEKAVSEHTVVVRKKRVEDLAVPETKLKSSRMSPRLVAKLRKRLSLTRKEFGLLAGVSSNTVYLWENGRVAPTKKSRAVLIGMRRLRVREARKLLEPIIAKGKAAAARK